MTTYNWEFGSLDAAVHFTVTYDSEVGTFTVMCDKGSFDLGALWFSDGDPTKDFATSLTKADNSLNMNGTSTVWADDGTTTQEKIVWDSYAKPTEPTTITEGSTITVTLTGTETQFLSQLDGGDFTLGVRSTSVNGTSDGFKWADTQPEIITNEVITNQAPTANNDSLTATEDTPIIYTATQLLGNDTDDGSHDALHIESVTSGTGGTALLNSDGTVTFTPNADFNGTANFTYTVSDGLLTSSAATVNVTVASVNDAPVLTAGTLAALTINEDSGTTSLGLSGINFGPGGGSDETSQTLSYKVTTVPADSLGNVLLADGITIVTADTSYTLDQIQGMQFQTTANANGTGTFSFTIQDDGGTSNGGGDTLSNSLTITVNPINDAPVAVADALWVSESTTAKSTTITLPISVLLGNDTDIDGMAITLQSITSSDPNITSVSFNSEKQTFSFVFAEDTATSNGHAGTVADPGLATFTYTISDNASPALTSTGMVNVNIVAISDSARASDTINISDQTYQGSYIDSGNGTDTLTGSSPGDFLIGGNQNDILNGGNGNDILQGGGQNDTLNGGTGMDLLDYSTADGDFSLTLGADGSGTSTVQGTDTYSNMEGVIGNGGNNTLIGNASDNILIGGGGTDTLYGLEGNDILRGGLGDGDKMDGGTGTDLLDFSDGSIAISFTLQQGTTAGGGYHSIADGTGGLGTGDGYMNMEGVIGTNLGDNISGSSLNDALMGGAGNDILHGGDGNDTLIGGAGADTLEGGNGSDSFVFLKGDAASVDTISDFTTGAGGDSLDISSVLSDSGVSAETLGGYVSVREYDGNTIVSVDTDAGGTVPAQDIAILTDVTNVTLENLNITFNNT